MAGKELEKIILIIALIVIIIIAIGSFSMMFMLGGMGYRGMMGSGMIGWSGMGFGWTIFLTIIFLLILIAGVYLVLTSYRRDQMKPEFNVNPIEILKERYARGEITSEEFKRMKRNLTD